MENAWNHQQTEACVKSSSVGYKLERVQGSHNVCDRKKQVVAEKGAQL